MRCVKFLPAALLLLLSACSSAPSDPIPGPAAEEEIKAKRDDLIACKDAKGKKGDVRIFRIEKASAAESKQWKQEVVAVGLRGTLDGESVSYSQGDQPDVASIERHGDKIELRMLDKQCAGHCDNFMILSSGGGEDEETTFIRIARLVIDTHDDEVTIEGKTQSFGGADKPTTITFQKCDVNAKLIDSVEGDVK
jgi:hypothetical protein